MSRANVPKFGNWENDDNVPYTLYFDKARKTKGGGKMINPNDPQENPDMFPNPDPSAAPLESRTTSDEPNGRGGTEAVAGRRMSKEDGDFRQQLGETKTGNESSYGGRGQRGGRPGRTSTGSEQSFERSPLHPQQARVMGRGSGSPAWDGKNHDSSHGTPGRSRLRPTRGDESPDVGAAVPRFGEWDENDPQAAENFTHIFNKVREERNNEAGNVSGTPKHQPYGTHGQQPNQPKVRSLNAAADGGRRRQEEEEDEE